jgi:hypothetical protein
MNDLLEESKKIIEIMKNTVPISMSNDEHKSYNNCKNCYICNGEFTKEDHKVRDHCHITGKYNGPAHNSCNKNIGFKNYKIPVIIHNLRGYDSHLILKNLVDTENTKISCIPITSEQYLSFTVNNLQFVDSFSFMGTSLEKLVNFLIEPKKGKDQVLNNINTKFSHIQTLKNNLSDELKMLITRKGVYPYDYMNSLSKFDETSLPSIDKFFNILNNESISQSEYEHAKCVYEKFNCKNLGKYHDLYLYSDVLLLADVFENFRKTAMKIYSLDPSWYYTAPGLAWDAMLKMTGVKIDQITDYDMYLFIERSKRGGISVVTTRYSKANNKYLNENYNPNEEDKYIMYLDANNLYGFSMIQKLPYKNYQWDESKWDEKRILSLKDDADVGYMFDVDLEYPEELHEIHNDYPLAPESYTVKREELSQKCVELSKIIDHKHSNFSKLVPTLYDKNNYVCHYRNLKLYVSLGLKIKKINRVLSFEQSAFMEKYIMENTRNRAIASQNKNDFEKDFFKLMNNSVFGKTMENTRNRIRYELVTNKKRYAKIVNNPNFTNVDIISDSLVGCSRSNAVVKLDKPIIIGCAILDLSKVLMYEFHYNVMKNKYKNDCKLLFTDTDSLCYEIKTKDLYEDMKNMNGLEYLFSDSTKDSGLFDFSEYPKNNDLYSQANEKVIGKFKDEASFNHITEFVGLRAKMYSYTQIDQSTHNKAKGIKKSCAKDIHFDSYKKAIFSNERYDIQQTASFNSIRSHGHQLYSVKNHKIGLCSYDDKRYILEDNINTLAYGHKDIKKIL